MYEQNREPLPEGDASVVFAKQLAQMQRQASTRTSEEITRANVLRWANSNNQQHFAAMCRRLLLPGSGIAGLENLRRIVELALEGNSCLLCMNHRSNADVPTLDALLEDHGAPELFQKIIWIAGRKLEEDLGLTRVLVQCFNRVILSPPSWFAGEHSEEEIHVARQMNIAAERSIAELRHQGWVFALFPSGTRIRPGKEETERAIAQMDSYLKLFDYLLLGNIDGCTLPVSKDRDMTHETPKLDRMRYTFSEVLQTRDWRSAAATRYPELDQKTASARAIKEDIEALSPDA